MGLQPILIINTTTFKTNIISMHKTLALTTFGLVYTNNIKIYFYRDQSKESISE